MRYGLKMSLFLVIALILAACSSTPSAQEIHLGVVTSLTGPLAATGKQVLVGVQYAAKTINDKGGINGAKVIVDAEDDQGTNTGAVNAFNKLTSMGQSFPANKKLVAIWDPTFTPLVMATAEAVAAAKIPVFTSATSPVVTKAPGGWFLRLRTNDNQAAAIVAQFALQELKTARPAILYPDNDYGKGGYGIMKEAFEKAGVKFVATETFQQAAQDVSAQLLKIKAASPDVFIAWTVPADSGLVSNQVKQIDLKATVLGGPGFGTPEYLGLAKDTAEGTYALVDAAIGSDDATAQWAKDVNAAFPGPVSFVVSTNHDGAMMLLEAVKSTGKYDGAALKTALLGVKNYKGITGPYTFDAEGNGLHQGVIGQWKAGKFVPLKTINQ